MDFFERQDQAKRNTGVLIAYFGLGVVLLVMAVYAAVLLIFASLGHQWWHPKIFLGSAAGTLIVIACGSLFKVMELSRGGPAVAEMLGGRLVNPSTRDPDERQLLNVVEEMALASGVPVPQVFVLPSEKSINAFAAGYSTGDAVVAVTQGTLRLLNRDELQGVIAHEFSHILNGDMRLNMRLMGLLFGILCIAVIGRILLRVRGGNRDRNPLPLLGILLLLIGWIGFFFGRLIQAAVSRQREFLADSAAVQFTRNPAGLASALKKIGGLSYGSRLEAAQAPEASHMFFGSGSDGPLLDLLSTHPPLEERIRALEPGFDGHFPRVAAQGEATPRTLEWKDVSPLHVHSRQRYVPGPPPAPPVIPAQQVTHRVGQITPPIVRYAQELRDSFSEPVREAARQPLGACALVYGLLLSNDSSIREKQLQRIADRVSIAARQETERLLPEVEEIVARTKLPLVDLAIPSLHLLSSAQFEQFRAAVRELIDLDGQVELFEYVLQKILLRHLEPQFGHARPLVTQYYALKPLMEDCAVLLSTLAHSGHEDPAQAERAFYRGAEPLCYAAQARISFQPQEACGLEQLDRSLERLSQASPQIRKNILNACAQAVATDGWILEVEAELLRAVADTLDCPIPPFALGEQAQERAEVSRVAVE